MKTEGKVTGYVQVDEKTIIEDAKKGKKVYLEWRNGNFALVVYGEKGGKK